MPEYRGFSLLYKFHARMLADVINPGQFNYILHGLN